jgi:leucyl aminopeptidase (aminopeptidase T)
MTTYLRIREMIQGAQNCIVKWGNLKNGEKVLIITDPMVDPQLIEALGTAASAAGGEVIITIIPTVEREHVEPPAPVVAAMKEVNLILACCSKLVGQTAATFEAQKRGARYMGIGPRADAMASAGAKFPPEIIFAMCTEMAKKWMAAREIRVMDPKGTDLRAKIDPGDVIGLEGAGAPLGTLLNPEKPRRGRIAYWEGGFGTVGYWPRWTTEGVAYMDAMEGFPGILPVSPKVTVEKGRVVKFEGAPEQELYFKSLIEKFGQDVAHIGEIMIGMNPHSPLNLEGSTHLQAHRRAGTVHIAYGNSVDDFRTVKPGVHIDNLIIKPTITLDGEPILKEGRLLMLDDPKFQEMGKRFGVSF